MLVSKQKDGNSRKGGIVNNPKVSINNSSQKEIKTKKHKKKQKSENQQNATESIEEYVLVNEIQMMEELYSDRKLQSIWNMEEETTFESSVEINEILASNPNEKLLNLLESRWKKENQTSKDYQKDTMDIEAEIHQNPTSQGIDLIESVKLNSILQENLKLQREPRSMLTFNHIPMPKPRIRKKLE